MEAFAVMRFSMKVGAILGVAVIAGLSVYSDRSANAQLILIFNGVINGATPVGASPWLRATFTTVSTGTVNLNLENLLPSGEFVDDWGFNVNPSLTAVLDGTTLSGMTVTQQTGKAIQAFGSGSVKGVNASNGGPNMKAGLFDLVFDWPTPASARFSGGTNATFQITGSGLTENSFDFLTTDDGHMFGGPYYSAAHVQGIPTGNSGSIYGTQVVIQHSSVPEPGNVALLTGLLVPAAALVRRWSKR
jgi:hypothetical protein